MSSKDSTEHGEVSLSERYVSSMVLAGVGDAMGFRNMRWEFMKSGPKIHKELEMLGGLKKLNIRCEYIHLNSQSSRVQKLGCV